MGNIASHCFSSSEGRNTLILQTDVTRASNPIIAINKQSSSDRTSDLPDDILYHILSFLPIKSIAKTSVLSRRWGFIWASIPVLDFSDILHPSTEFDKAMKFMTSLLYRRHENYNIQVFRVKIPLSSSGLNNLIRLLVNHRVVELKLELLISESFELPECLLECNSLRSLTLRGRSPYVWNPLLKFSYPCVLAKRGLRLLHTLDLSELDFSDSADLGNMDLFHGSEAFPYLEKLFIGECEGITHLKISCPNLKDLTVRFMKVTSLDISGTRLEIPGVHSNVFKGENEGDCFFDK